MTADHTDPKDGGPVAILQHEVECPPSTVARVLEAERVPYVVRRLDVADRVPTGRELASLSALVVLGGGMNTDEDDRYPWLEDEREALRVAVERDVPVLAICLGAQQLAAATGGLVYHREIPERGWRPIDVTDGDELFEGLPRRFSALQWHKDSFAAPEQAVVFAESDGGQQAFRLGRRAWGVQFHPEADNELLEHWFLDADREDPAFGKLLRETRAEIVAGSVALCTIIVRNFLRAL